MPFIPSLAFFGRISLLTSTLAEFAISDLSFPPATMQAAHNCVVDLVSAVVAGSRHPGAIAARRSVPGIWGAGDTALWFSVERSQPAGAVFANAVAASIFDIDDGYRPSVGHPGAPIITAVLTVGHRLGASMQEMLGAIIVGYEIALRIATARDYSKIESLATGRWCGQGVAAALGRLYKDTSKTIAQAISIAGAIAPNAAASNYSRVGNYVKEAIPFAATNGVMAVNLARAGYLGQIDLLDDPDHFSSAAIIDGLGSSWLIESTYFKPYSCCRWAHAAIDAVYDMREQVDEASIRSIEIDIFSTALILSNHLAPASLQEAQYSIPFCVALAFFHGKEVFMPMNDDRILRDGRVLELARKIRLSVDPGFNKMFPVSVPSRVTIYAQTGKTTKTILSPKGDQPNRFDRNELLEKFRIVSERSIDRASADGLYQALLDMENDGYSQLIARLQGQIGDPLCLHS
jgi:2-methylcitrate dehydratase PrpD